MAGGDGDREHLGMQTAHGESGQAGPADPAWNRKVDVGVQAGEAAGHRSPQRTGPVFRLGDVGDRALL